MTQANDNPVAEDQVLVVQCGRLIDGTGAPPARDVSLVIEGGAIREILPTERARAEAALRGARVLDASRATVLPGLMDVHVHLGSVNDPDEPHSLLSLMGASSPLLTLHAAKNARLCLEAGFTAVRDLAGYPNLRNAEVVGLRRGVEIGLVPGPRIFAAGWVGPTAGHGDMGPPITWPRTGEDQADGPWAVRKMVREVVRLGVDLIKTSASGGGGGHGEQIWWRGYTFEELQAAADEAHAYGKKLAVHVYTAEGMKRSLRAGADTIEHGTDVDDEVIELFLQTGAFLVPTLSQRSPRGLAGRMRGGAHPSILKKHQAMAGAGREALGRAHRAGVKVACGTDTYRSLREHWGGNAYELEMLVEAGLSPMEALVAATKTGAEALGQQERLGTLEPGKLADLLVFDGDPLADIRLLQEKERIRLVLKGGQVVVDRRG